MKKNEDKQKGGFIPTLVCLSIVIGLAVIVLWSCSSTLKDCNQRRKDEREQEIESILDEYAEDYVSRRYEEKIYAESPEDFTNSYELIDVFKWYFDDTESENEWIRERFDLSVFDNETIRRWVLDHYDLEDVKTWYEEAK